MKDGILGTLFTVGFIVVLIINSRPDSPPNLVTLTNLIFLIGFFGFVPLAKFLEWRDEQRASSKGKKPH